MKNPRKIWDVLTSMENQDEFDPAGFEALKSVMSKSPGIKIKT